MKKFSIRLVALCCAAVTLFTLASCKNGAKVTPTDAVVDAKRAGIEELAVTKDLKDDKGKVVYKLNIVLPQLDMASFANAQAINSVYTMRAQDMQDFAQNNVKNASTFINKNETSEPWVCEARYSITYRDAKYLCILCEYSYGMGTTSRSKRLQGDCFLLEKGTQCRLNDFLLDGVKADAVFEMIADATIEKMVDSYGRNRLNSDMTRDKLIEIKKASPNDFYITDKGITFFYQLASIAPFSEGVLEFSFTADEMKDLMTLPMTQK